MARISVRSGFVHGLNDCNGSNMFKATYKRLLSVTSLFDDMDNVDDDAWTTSFHTEPYCVSTNVFDIAHKRVVDFKKGPLKGANHCDILPDCSGSSLKSKVENQTLRFLFM